MNTGGVCKITICDSEAVNGVLEVELGSGKELIFQLTQDDKLITAETSCYDPATLQPTVSPSFSPTNFPTDDDDDGDDGKRYTTQNIRSRSLDGNGGRCSCGIVGRAADQTLMSLLGCVNGNGQLVECTDELSATLEFDVASLFQKEAEDDTDTGRDNIIKIILSVLVVGSVAIVIVALQYKRQKKKQSIDGGTENYLQSFDEASALGSPRAQQASQAGTPPMPSPISVRTHVFKSSPIPSLNSQIQRRHSDVTKSSLRTSYRTFHRSRKNTQLGVILKNRFSARLSIATDPISVKSDVYNMEVATYRSQISEEERSRYRSFRSQSMSVTESIAQVPLLRTFGDKSLKNPAQWLELTKKVIHRVCAELESEILSATEVAELEEEEMTSSGVAPKPLEEFSQDEPNISLENYLFRLVVGLNRWFTETTNVELVGIRSLLISLIYLAKIRTKEIHFTLTVYNVHRLFSTMMLVAAKFTEDELISNEFWGQVSGIKMKEVNQLEEAFCFSSGFDFYIRNRELGEAYRLFGLADLAELDTQPSKGAKKNTPVAKPSASRTAAYSESKTIESVMEVSL